MKAEIAEVPRSTAAMNDFGSFHSHLIKKVGELPIRTLRAPQGPSPTIEKVPTPELRVWETLSQASVQNVADLERARQ